MEGAHGGALRGRDFDAVADRGLAETAAPLAEPAGDAARYRPLERAAEGRQRDRHGVDRPASVEAGHLLLQLLVRELQLAGELRVEIATRVDLGDQRGARRQGAVCGGARLRPLRFPASAARAALPRASRAPA